MATVRRREGKLPGRGILLAFQKFEWIDWFNSKFDLERQIYHDGLSRLKCKNWYYNDWEGTGRRTLPGEINNTQPNKHTHTRILDLIPLPLQLQHLDVLY